MDNLLRCIGFKGYNFCKEPVQPQENFYKNDIKRRFYQCKKCRIGRQSYITNYVKTKLGLWRASDNQTQNNWFQEFKDIPKETRKKLYREARDSFNETNAPVIEKMQKAPEYNYPEFPDEVKKELEEKALKQKSNGTQDTRGCWLIQHGITSR